MKLSTKIDVPNDEVKCDEQQTEKETLMAIGGYRPNYPCRPDAKCPEWMQKALHFAMDYLVENELFFVPGDHKWQFDGVAVTLVVPVPDKEGRPLVVWAKEFDGKTWQLIVTRKPGLQC